jgi:hypothetical protein
MTDDTKNPKNTQAEDSEPARHGDILGITDADPNVEIPRATEDRSGNPKGIDVRGHASGIGHLKQTKGATAIDMGAGGTGTGVKPGS